MGTAKKTWLIVLGVAGGGCCVVGAGMTALAALAGLEEGPAAPAPAPASDPSAQDDTGVLYETVQGTFVAEARVVEARAGLPAQPVGVWLDDKQNVALRLGADGQYALQYQASGPSGGVGYLERGSWRGQGEGLVLAPTSLQRSSAFVFSDTPGVRAHAESEALTPGPARGWVARAATLDFVANWENPARVARREGLLLQGAPPPELWTGGGPIDLTLRRARRMPGER